MQKCTVDVCCPFRHRAQLRSRLRGSCECERNKEQINKPSYSSCFFLQSMNVPIPTLSRHSIFWSWCSSRTSIQPLLRSKHQALECHVVSFYIRKRKNPKLIYPLIGPCTKYLYCIVQTAGSTNPRYKAQQLPENKKSLLVCFKF